MGKIAKLVTVTLTTRIIVDSDWDDATIFELAAPKLVDKLTNEGFENCEEIIEDIECPFDETDL